MAFHADLSERLENLVSRAPGVGAIVLGRGRATTVAVGGLRIAGRAEPVRRGDAWHVGSCTKAMTATAMARLWVRGMVDIDAPLADHLPDIAMHSDFAATPLRRLMTHEAGVRRDPHSSVFNRLRASRATVVQQRHHMTALALVDRPFAKAGYSNLGYIVLGSVIEAVTGRPWERVIAEEVFRPLGMTSAGFGAPRLPGSTGHIEREGRWRPKPPGPYADNPRVYGPAGRVHLSLEDWARFAMLHLGDSPSDYLPSAVLRDLHMPSANGYAAGWGVGKMPDGSRLLRHTGSNTMWFANIQLAPAHGIGVAVVCNAYSPPLHQHVLAFTDDLLADAFQMRGNAVALRRN